MRLILIRHGIAVDREDAGCPPDPDRYLTKEGTARTREAMLGLQSLDVKPEVILSSPYVRAVQTAKLAAEAFQIPERKVRRTEALLPGADPSDLLGELGKISVACVACCGHAPNLDEVLAHAVGARGAFTALKKAGAACVEVDPDQPGTGTLHWLYLPATLRKIRK